MATSNSSKRDIALQLTATAWLLSPCPSTWAFRSLCRNPPVAPGEVKDLRKRKTENSHGLHEVPARYQARSGVPTGRLIVDYSKVLDGPKPNAEHP